MGKMPERFSRAGSRSKPEFFKDGNKLDWPKPRVSRQSRRDVKATRSLQVGVHYSCFLWVVIVIIHFYRISSRQRITSIDTSLIWYKSSQRSILHSDYQSEKRYGTLTLNWKYRWSLINERIACARALYHLHLILFYQGPRTHRIVIFNQFFSFHMGTSFLDLKRKPKRSWI